MKNRNQINNLNRIISTAVSHLNSGDFKHGRDLLEKNAELLGNQQVFHNLLGAAHAGLRDHDIAVRHFKKSIQINPLDPFPFSGIANSLCKNLQFDEAEKYYKLALIVDENFLDAVAGMGTVAFQRSDYLAAEQFFKRALEKKPHQPTVLTNLANTYSVQGRYDLAMPLWDKALKLNPSNMQAKLNRGMAGLGMGRYETAWDDYESRFHEDNFIPQRFSSLPQWPGPSNQQSKVLIWAEQGVGDELMFASMFAELQHMKEAFVIECIPRLIEIFQESFPRLLFFQKGTLSDASQFDYQISIASLGKILRRSAPSFEKNRPKGGYLALPKGELSPRTLEALDKLPKPWIGVSWESYALTQNFRNRKSISCTEFSNFTNDFNGSFINLQFPNPHKHEKRETQEIPNNIFTLPDLDLKNDLKGIARLMKRLDHVVTIGNTTAHLAGAFGVSASVLLPVVADWRWGFSGNESPWYESLHLYRNSDPVSWRELLTTARKELMNRSENSFSNATAN